MDILVVGGTRFMGKETVLELGHAGHNVSVFNRGNHHVQWPFRVEELAGDRNNPADLRQLDVREFDAAIDFCAYTGHQTQSLIEALGPATHLLHVSSGAVYEPVPELPWSEDVALGPWPLWGPYGEGKVECERVLERERGGVAARISIRLPYVLGPENYADREEFVLNRILDGEAIGIPGDGQGVIQFISCTQVATSIGLIVRSLAGGSGLMVTADAINLASTKNLATLEGFVRLCGDVVGVEPTIRRVEGLSLDAMRPLDADSMVFPFPNASYILDTTRADEAGFLGPSVRTRTMIEEALEALVRRPQRREWQRTTAERELL